MTHEYFLFHGTAQEDEEEPWWDDNSDIFMVDFQMGGLIDKTVTSRVYRVSKDGLDYAAKVIQKRNAVRREVDVMMHLANVKGVTHLQAYYDLGRGKIGDHPTPAEVLVMDMPEGPTATYHRVVNTKTDEEKRRILSRLVQILRRIDERGVAHNDLHANNFLVSGADDRVTLIDFGRAEYKNRPFDMTEEYREWCRSPPELRNQGVFDYDRLTTWTMGLIVKQSFTVVPPIAQNLLDSLFAPFHRRMSLHQMFDHPYFAV